jgi:isoleucyl-tRNA synthetase
VAQVMPFSTACHTPLSNFEANLGQKEDVVDPAVTVMFPLEDDPNTIMLAWTTTPWTLPSNLALNVNPGHTYVKVLETKTGRHFIVGESLYASVFPQPKKPKKADGKAVEEPFKIVDSFPGRALGGKKYVPPFDFFVKEWTPSGAFRILLADYVTNDSGTGVVHSAPGFGVDDFETCHKAGIIGSENVPCPVDDNGCFTAPVQPWLGVHVKTSDPLIIEALKKMGRLYHSTTIKHTYPYCWRSDTPLIYRAVPSWFVRVESIKKELVAENLKTHWVPSNVSEKRFHNWLEGAQDWCISRNRFWGTPIPLWRSADGLVTECIGSVEQLQKLTKGQVTDLHVHKIQDIVMPDPRGPEFPPLRRVDEVFDCWFESGSMPFAQKHYPFENQERFEKTFPADFISEASDQTRGWFYTLMVLSVALRGVAPFKNVIVTGLVLAEDGKKMSKKLMNYPDPVLIMEKHGADAVRLYLINSPVVKAESLKFREEGVSNVIKDVLKPWYNAYRFCVENCKKFEVDNGGKPFEFDMERGVRQTKNVTDVWILSVTQSLIKFVRAEMAEYRLYTVVPILLKHIEQLTNWYIRFNRKRLKGSEGTQDAFHALCVLFFVLYQQTVVMAPFTPFFAELLYQNLRMALPAAERKDSVHYVMIPEPDASLINPGIEATMIKLQNVVELARAARDRRTLPVKTPLPCLHVVHSSPAVIQGLAPFLPYVREELNVREVRPSSSEADFVRLVADINDKVCGRKLRNKMGAVRSVVTKLGDPEVRAAQQAGRLQVDEFELTMDDLVIVRQFQGDKAKLEPSWNDEVLIVLDVDATPEMVCEGTARSIANVVQKLRKSCGVQATDNLRVFYCVEQAGAEQLPKLLADWSAFVSKKIGRPFSEIAPGDLAKHEFAGNQRVEGFGAGCVFSIYITKPDGTAPGGN